MSIKHLLRPLLGSTRLLASTLSAASVIQTTQISPSTTLMPFTYGQQTFTLEQLHDGITVDAPFNGFASNGTTNGTITLSLDKAYDLQSFVLWNDINVRNEGVRTFELRFLDSSNIQIGSSGMLTAVSQLAPQTYSFSTVAGVKSVLLDVSSASLQIEIRELAFNGNISAVPEPASAVLALAGLAVVAAAIRRRT